MCKTLNRKIFCLEPFLTFPDFFDNEVVFHDYISEMRNIFPEQPMLEMVQPSFFKFQ